MILIFRAIAFSIDYFVLAIYGCLLFFVAIQLQLDQAISSPWFAHLISFCTLTLPVFLYFSVSESRSWNGTIGKRLCKLKLTNQSGGSPSILDVVKRNGLKFLPWEMGHTGVHWVYHYNRQDLDPPVWVWGLLIGAQILMLAMLVCVFFNPARQALYGLMSKTKVAWIANQCFEDPVN